MRLLLHACCTDCILKFIDSIKEEKEKFKEIVVYFYNPNIQPRSEYLSRLKSLQKIAEEKNIRVIVPDWSPKEYFKSIKSKKKGKRCLDCWSLRLEKSFKYAKENGFKMVSSTLISSQYQNREKIEEIGNNLAKKYGIEFWIAKNINCKLKTKGFYKQNYCGCCYSLVERSEEKFI